MNFAYPHILYLLILIPVLLGLFFWARVRRAVKLRRYGRPDVLASLMPDASSYTPWIKISLELLALTFIIIACARPRYGEKEQQETTNGIEVMIALDVSRSMNASSTDDPNGISRLNRAKFLLGKLVDALDNDRVGLIVFAGESYTQLPITTDFVSAKMYINDINTEMVSTQGTAIGTAIGKAINSFSPDENINRAIIVITDGENHEGDAVDMARHAHDNGIQVDVIGIGSLKGAPIPVNGSRGEFLKDYNGQPVTTTLNEEMAREIAKAGGGVYISGSASNAVTELTDQLDLLQKAELKNVKYKASAEQFPLFVFLGLLMLLIDTFVLDRKITWLKKYNFFTK